eukprot:Gb_35435 [translate_table: standard]
MTAGAHKMHLARALGARPDRAIVEEARHAVARIESELVRRLKAIAALPTPSSMEFVQWQTARAAMEAQATKDAEKEKLAYKSVIQLAEIHQIYENLVNDAKTVAETPKGSNLLVSMECKSPVQEAEYKIAAALHEVSGRNGTKLDLSGLLIDNVPNSIEKMSTLVKLDLSNNNLECLPESVTSLVNLISLDVHSNQLKVLPDSIGRLVKLKVLNVSSNSLAAFPETIENCRALEELIADFNQLTRLPEALGFELLNLRKLSVHSNKISYLPSSASHMMSLRVLDVHLNRLKSLPADLENLMNLEILNLSQNFNYLVALPDSIGGLTSLIELDVSYNQIRILPASIGGLKKLERLKAEGNPLIVPPPRIVEHSVEAIKQYLEEERMKNSRGESREGTKSRAGHGHGSWFGHLVWGKWVRCGTPFGSGMDANALQWHEYRPNEEAGFSSPRPGFFSPLRFFSPRHSSSPLRTLSSPRRTPHHWYSPRHVK